MRKPQLLFILILAAIVIFSVFSQCHSGDTSVTREAPRTEAVSTGLAGTDPEAASRLQAPGAALSATTTTLESAQLKITPEEVTAKRNQAKSVLSNAYTAQSSYFYEYGRYTTDLLSAGSYPPSRVMNYKFGFLRPKASGPSIDGLSEENPARMNSDSFEGESFGNADEKYAYSTEAQSIRLDNYGSLCQADCTATEDQFEMILVFPLDGAHFDVWLINQKKEMILIQDGAIAP